MSEKRKFLRYQCPVCNREMSLVQNATQENERTGIIETQHTYVCPEDQVWFNVALPKGISVHFYEPVFLPDTVGQVDDLQASFAQKRWSETRKRLPFAAMEKVAE